MMTLQIGQFQSFFCGKCVGQPSELGHLLRETQKIFMGITTIQYGKWADTLGAFGRRKSWMSTRWAKLWLPSANNVVWWLSSSCTELACGLMMSDGVHNPTDVGWFWHWCIELHRPCILHIQFHDASLMLVRMCVLCNDFWARFPLAGTVYSEPSYFPSKHPF